MNGFNLFIRVKGNVYEAYEDNGYYYANIYGDITAVHVDDAELVGSGPVESKDECGCCGRVLTDREQAESEGDIEFIMCKKCNFVYPLGTEKCYYCGSALTDSEPAEPTAMTTQIGGNHYKDLEIQPIEYCHKNKMGYCESNVVKYVTRWKFKNGLQDLKKAIHNIQLLIELEGLEDEKRTL